MRQNLQHIESVVSRFKSFQAGAHTQHSHAAMEKINSVLEKYKKLEPQLRELDLYEAGHFNLFEIMKINYYEVLVHTPVLCNLLDPKGSHAQGDLFYQRFIETVFDREDAARFTSYDKNRVKVQDELFTRFGQIDIFVQHNSTTNPYLWIIENKIFAGDQENQLFRYYEYAKSIQGFDDRNIRVLYLKPFEGNPSAHSIDSKSLEVLSGSGVFKIISYEKHILPWLQSCLEEIKAPVVKYTVLQYIHTLKAICR